MFLSHGWHASSFFPVRLCWTVFCNERAIPMEVKGMSPDFVVGFGRQAIELCLMMSLPMLGVGLGVGVLVSVIQAATQIQEQTLTFIPKIVCMFIALLLALPWLIERMTTFTRDVIINIPTYVH